MTPELSFPFPSFDGMG